LFDQDDEYEAQSTTKANNANTAAFKSQARAIINQVKSPKDWKPTWAELPRNWRAMAGAVTAPPPSASSQPALQSTATSTNPEDGRSEGKP